MSEESYRPPYLAAALTGLALLALYALTLAPSTAMWDTSEYISTAYILGLPHPPGNPLFVSLGRVWIVLLAPTGLSVAVRMNLFAATTSAASAALWFLVAHRLLTPVLKDRRAALAGAAVAVLVAGTAFTVWNQSNVNEKVYTVSMLVIALASWLALRWRDLRDRPGSLRYLLLAGYLLALGSTNHLMSVLPLPVLALFVLGVEPRTLLRGRLWALGIPLLALGVSLNFFLPIRAAENPVINEGEPTCESATGAAVAVFTNGKAGCPNLAYNLSRAQYQPIPVTQRKAPFGAQMLNWYQYFDWQWSRGAARSELPGTPSRTLFTLLFGVLGLAGLWAVVRTDRMAAVYLGGLTLTLTVGLVVYLNFKYGYSLAPEVTDLARHEVRERDYFFVAGFGLWGLLAGMGLAWCWAVLAERVRGARRYLLTSPVLLVAFIPLTLNWAWASRAGDWAARDWAYDLLASVEPYGVIFTNGDNDTFPLWYVQEVEGVRRDVTVIVGEYLRTGWYLAQLQDLTRPGTQRPFRPGDAGGIYRAADVPNQPITRLTREQMDSVVGGTLPTDQTIPFGSIALTFPKGMYLDRGQRLALAVIRDSLGERPIYFSSTSGMMDQMGLRPFAVRQGIVTKLDLQGPENNEAYVQGTPSYGGEWFDADRSFRLYRDVYRYRGLRDRDIWTDRSTLNIPWHFYALALQLSDIARVQGQPQSVVQGLEEDAQAFGIVAQGGSRGIPDTSESGQ